MYARPRKVSEMPYEDLIVIRKMAKIVAETNDDEEFDGAMLTMIEAACDPPDSVQEMDLDWTTP